ncbi:hypothetical protein [Escherichia coli]|uniref:hypothetical protein n=1 Tax=Escherichia coli TaxID=562 RepID=UPI00202CD15B|nr:hypothetical protein [Escherichia coli]
MITKKGVVVQINQDVMNITGLEQVDTFILGEQNCTANLLNMENISPLFAMTALTLG